MLCRQQVAELEKQRHRFETRKGRLAVIGSGDPSHLSEFREITGYGGTLLSDPSRASYRMLGLSANVRGMFGTKSIRKALSALRHGVRPGSIQGSALQLGGAVVISPAGEVKYLYRSNEAADDPPVEELLEALE